jgi:hypothetical protein
MKVLRAFFTFILVIIIVGGIGYIAWSMYYGPYNSIAEIFPWNANQGANTADPNAQGNMNMSGMDMTGNNPMTPSTGTDTQNNNNLTYNAIALQNREKLMEVQSMLNQAIDLITMDPYSRVTVPSSTDSNMQMPQTQSNTGTINIYPNGTNSLNIVPPTTGEGNTGAGTTDTSAMPGMPNMNTATMTSANYVYDQAKLEQLHRGIVRLAQGMMYLTQLNEDITIQASTIEPNYNNYQTYMDRYNKIIKNKAKLNNAVASINQATELVNVNPYGGTNGYQYNAQYMDQMHRGIFTLAQAMVLANDLNEDMTAQMVQAVTSAQYAIYNNNMGNMPGMDNTGNWSSVFNATSISTVFNLILVIMVVLLIVSVFGALGNILKGGNKNDKRAKTKSDTNV